MIHVLVFLPAPVLPVDEVTSIPEPNEHTRTEELDAGATTPVVALSDQSSPDASDGHVLRTGDIAEDASGATDITQKSAILEENIAERSQLSPSSPVSEAQDNAITEREALTVEKLSESISPVDETVLEESSSLSTDQKDYTPSEEIALAFAPSVSNADLYEGITHAGSEHSKPINASEDPTSGELTDVNVDGNGALTSANEPTLSVTDLESPPQDGVDRQVVETTEHVDALDGVEHDAVPSAALESLTKPTNEESIVPEDYEAGTTSAPGELKLVDAAEQLANAERLDENNDVTAPNDLATDIIQEPVIENSFIGISDVTAHVTEVEQPHIAGDIDTSASAPGTLTPTIIDAVDDIGLERTVNTERDTEAISDDDVADAEVPSLAPEVPPFVPTNVTSDPDHPAGNQDTFADDLDNDSAASTPERNALVPDVAEGRISPTSTPPDLPVASPPVQEHHQVVEAIEEETPVNTQSLSESTTSPPLANEQPAVTDDDVDEAFISEEPENTEVKNVTIESLSAPDEKTNGSEDVAKDNDVSSGHVDTTPVLATSVDTHTQTIPGTPSEVIQLIDTGNDESTVIPAVPEYTTSAIAEAVTDTTSRVATADISVSTEEPVVPPHITGDELAPTTPVNTTEISVAANRETEPTVAEAAAADQQDQAAVQQNGELTVGAMPESLVGSTPTLANVEEPTAPSTNNEVSVIPEEPSAVDKQASDTNDNGRELFFEAYTKSAFTEKESPEFLVDNHHDERFAKDATGYFPTTQLVQLEAPHPAADDHIDQAAHVQVKSNTYYLEKLTYDKTHYQETETVPGTVLDTLVTNEVDVNLDSAISEDDRAQTSQTEEESSERRPVSGDSVDDAVPTVSGEILIPESDARNDVDSAPVERPNPGPTEVAPIQDVNIFVTRDQMAVSDDTERVAATPTMEQSMTSVIIAPIDDVEESNNEPMFIVGDIVVNGTQAPTMAEKKDQEEKTEEPPHLYEEQLSSEPNSIAVDHSAEAPIPQRPTSLAEEAASVQITESANADEDANAAEPVHVSEEKIAPAANEDSTFAEALDGFVELAPPHAQSPAIDVTEEQDIEPAEKVGVYKEDPLFLNERLESVPLIATEDGLVQEAKTAIDDVDDSMLLLKAQHIVEGKEEPTPMQEEFEPPVPRELFSDVAHIEETAPPTVSEGSLVFETDRATESALPAPALETTEELLNESSPVSAHVQESIPSSGSGIESLAPETSIVSEEPISQERDPVDDGHGLVPVGETNVNQEVTPHSVVKQEPFLSDSEEATSSVLDSVSTAELHILKEDEAEQHSSEREPMENGSEAVMKEVVPDDGIDQESLPPVAEENPVVLGPMSSESANILGLARQESNTDIERASLVKHISESIAVNVHIEEGSLQSPVTEETIAPEKDSGLPVEATKVTVGEAPKESTSESTEDELVSAPELTTTTADDARQEFTPPAPVEEPLANVSIPEPVVADLTVTGAEPQVSNNTSDVATVELSKHATEQERPIPDGTPEPVSADEDVVPSRPAELPVSEAGIAVGPGIELEPDVVKKEAVEQQTIELTTAQEERIPAHSHALIPDTSEQTVQKLIPADTPSAASVNEEVSKETSAPATEQSSSEVEVSSEDIPTDLAPHQELQLSGSEEPSAGPAPIQELQNPADAEGPLAGGDDEHVPIAEGQPAANVVPTHDIPDTPQQPTVAIDEEVPRDESTDLVVVSEAFTTAISAESTSTEELVRETVGPTSITPTHERSSDNNTTVQEFVIANENAVSADVEQTPLTERTQIELGEPAGSERDENASEAAAIQDTSDARQQSADNANIPSDLSTVGEDTSVVSTIPQTENGLTTQGTVEKAELTDVQENLQLSGIAEETPDIPAGDNASGNLHHGPTDIQRLEIPDSTSPLIAHANEFLTYLIVMH